MPVLRPNLTLRDLAGANIRLNSRASDRRGRWLPSDPLVRNAISGGSLAVCGDVPVLASARNVTPRARRLLEQGGIELPAKIETFESASDYPRRLEEFSRPGNVFMQHVHPPDDPPDDRYWLAPATLSYLNNKANLAELVAEESIPRRQVRPAASVRADLPGLPFVLKAVTDDSTGGGAAVAICRTTADVAEAFARFEGIEHLVVEELLEIERSFCLHFALHRDGTVRYLGAAEQICTAEGTYEGNWLDGVPPPDEAIVPAQAAMERAARYGYCGFAGVDVALTPAGPRVLDLNLRFNGSTAPLLLFDAIRAARGPVVARVQRWPCAGSDWEAALDAAIGEGRVVPKCIYDPAGGPHEGAPPLILAMILGRDREDVDAYLARGGA